MECNLTDLKWELFLLEEFALTDLNRRPLAC